MKIVVTDGYTLNPGDLSWHEIEAFGELTVYERTPPYLVTERCNEADIVLSNKVPIGKDVIENLPRLRLISVMATGYNVIDVAAAKSKKIVVCNVPAYGTASVAQHTIALMLELANHAGVHAQSVADGEWQRAADWSYTKKPVIELDGKILGIIGMGNIGRRVAQIAAALGMKIMYTGPRKKDDALSVFTDMKSLFTESDVISLHCPLKSDNHEFVNSALLRLMKPSSMLINTARGQLINEHDLADALNKNQIAGAALDVLSAEPPHESNPLLIAKNCIITPHNAWVSREARERILKTTAKNIEAFLQNRPVNVVN